MGANSVLSKSLLLLSLSSQFALAQTDFNSTPSDTAASVKQLNAYAVHLLSPNGALQKEADEEFLVLGIDPAFVPRMSSVYKIFISENSQECFWEDFWHPIKDYDINGSDDYQNLKKQFESAAIFVKEIYVSTRGRALGHFHPAIIDFCPRKLMNDRNFLYKDRKLTIGIPNPWGLDKFESLSSKVLMQRWDEGEIFKNKEESGLVGSIANKAKTIVVGKDPKEKLHALWFMINPVGHVRSVLRNLLHTRTLSFRKRLQETRTREDMLQLVEANIDADKIKDEAESQNTSQVSETSEASPREWIASLNDEELVELRNLWLKELSSGSLTESIGEAVIEEMQSPVMAQKIDIEVDQGKGLVAVENAHVIQVGVTVSTAKISRFISKTVPSELKVRVKQDGSLVNVSTKDVIAIFANFVLPAKTVESLSFVEVVDKMKILQRLKQNSGKVLFEQDAERPAKK